jgi:hypothetical protein
MIMLYVLKDIKKPTPKEYKNQEVQLRCVVFALQD